MDRLIATNSVNLAGADGPPATGTPQYATDGNPALNIPATRWPAYQYNAIQEEIMNVLIAAGVTPDKANNAQLLTALTGGRLGRTRLTANTTYYVDSATGNDATGTGAVGAPWKTLQFAYDWVANNLDLAGFSVSIRGTGAFTAGVICSRYIPGNGLDLATGLPNLSFTFTAGTSVIPAGSAYCFNIEAGYVYIDGGGNLSLSNATLGCLLCQSAFMAYGGVTFGAVPNGQWHVQGEAASTTFMVGNCTVSGNAGAHYSLAHGAAWRCGPALTLNVTGTPAFNTAFCNIAAAATWDNFNAGGAMVITGSATGARYQGVLGGIINTQGGGANYFPGNSAGSVSSGGQYV